MIARALRFIFSRKGLNVVEDYVNHPSHYSWGSKECIEVIEENLTAEEYAGYLKGTQIKYVYRHEHKWDAEQDLEKCDWYLKRYSEKLEKPNQPNDLSYAYESELYGDDAPTDKLINQYIYAVKDNDVTLCRAILNRLKERVSQTNIDLTSPNEADTGSEIKQGSQTTDISVEHAISDNAKQILCCLKFLGGWDLGLWENAYSFNYDDQTDVLSVETAINLQVNGYSQPVAVTLELMYRDARIWNITMHTPN